RQFRCRQSDAFPAFTWCHRKKKEQTKGGEVTSSTSILHSEDGTAAYINRYVEPAFFGLGDVQAEINRLSARFGSKPRLIRMRSRDGLPNAIIAVWGAIKLEQLSAAEISFVKSGQAVQGLLVSFLGDVQRSAKAGAPVYRIAGGAGFLWAATYNPE